MFHIGLFSFLSQNISAALMNIFERTRDSNRTRQCVDIIDIKATVFALEMKIKPYILKVYIKVEAYLYFKVHGGNSTVD